MTDRHARLHGQPDSAPHPLARVTPAAERTLPHASPLVRRFARDLGVDLTRVAGSGQHARIRQQDIEAFVRDAMAGGDRGGGATGELFDRIDMAPLLAYLDGLRDRAVSGGTLLTPLPFVIKAVSLALARHPAPCADAGRSIGAVILSATGVRGGLLPDAAGLGIVELARLLADLPPIADPDEPPAGLLVVDLGALSSAGHAPLLGPTTAAALGLSAPTDLDGKQIARIGLRYRPAQLDTAAAAGLLVEIAGSLADIRRLLL